MPSPERSLGRSTVKRDNLERRCWVQENARHPKREGDLMIERLTQRTMVLTAAVLCVAGIIDSIRVDSPSTAVIFGLLLVVGAAIARERASSRPVHVRPDLREWLDDTASLTGESIEEVSNAALSSYRAGMSSHHGS